MEVVEAGMEIVESIIEFGEFFQKFYLMFLSQARDQFVIEIADASKHYFPIFFEERFASDPQIFLEHVQIKAHFPVLSVVHVIVPALEQCRLSSLIFILFRLYFENPLFNEVESRNNLKNCF